MNAPIQERSVPLDLQQPFTINRNNLDLVNVNGVWCFSGCPSADFRAPDKAKPLSTSITHAGIVLFCDNIIVNDIDTDSDNITISLASSNSNSVPQNLYDAWLDQKLLLKEQTVSDYRHQLPPDFVDSFEQIQSFINSALGEVNRLSELEHVLTSKVWIAETIYEKTKHRWIEVLESINASYINLRSNKDLASAAQKYTQACLTTVLTKGHSWHRSYHKPLGYPGDYEVMNILYDDKSIGDNVESILLHHYGVHSGRMIPARLELLSNQIIKIITSVKEEIEPVSLVSIGSGPARELENIANALSPRPIHIDLLDTEPLAHKFVSENISKTKFNTQVTYECHDTNFLALARTNFDPSLIENADIVYSSGLVDYFNHTIAVKFIKNTMKAMKKGSCLIIANVNDTKYGSIWVMECALDWPLYFRSETEMTSIAADAGVTKFDLLHDHTRGVYMLTLYKT